MGRLWWIFPTGILFLLGAEVIGLLSVSAGISVHHKVRRELVTEVPYEDVFSSVQFLAGKKTYLVEAKPEDGCGDLESPPSVALESVDGGGGGGGGSPARIQWVILMKESNQCSWHSRVVRAKVKGFIGVIGFPGNESYKSDNMELKKTDDWSSLEGFKMNISIVNAKDATKLKDYTYPKPYTVTMNKDFKWGDFFKEVFDSAIILKRNIFTWYEKKILAPLNSTYETASKVGWAVFVIGFCVIYSVKWYIRKLEEIENEDRRREWRQRERFARNNNNNAYREAQARQRPVENLQYYRQLFGVQPGATSEQIRSAYRRIAREHHEDWTRQKNYSEAEIRRRSEMLQTVIPRAREALLRACAQ